MKPDYAKTHVVADLAHDNPLISCRFDPSGTYVFAGSQDYSVWRFKIGTDEKVQFDAEAWVRGIAFSQDGSKVITAGYDGRLIWWDTASEKPAASRTVQAHEGWVRAVDVSPDGRLLASVGNDMAVRLWNMETGNKVAELAGHESHIYNAAFHPTKSDQLVTGDLMCNVIHWDISAGKQQRTWKAESLQKFDKTFVATIGGFRGMVFTADGSHLLCSGITNVTNAFAGVGNPSVVAFDWNTGKQSVEHLSKGKLRGVAWGVAAHPDGTRIAATGGSAGYLLFWKPGEASEFHNLKLKDVGRDLDLSPDGMSAAVAHHNGHISVCKLAAKESA